MAVTYAPTGTMGALRAKFLEEKGFRRPCGRMRKFVHFPTRQVIFRHASSFAPSESVTSSWERASGDSSPSTLYKGNPPPKCSQRIRLARPPTLQVPAPQSLAKIRNFLFLAPIFLSSPAPHAESFGPTPPPRAPVHSSVPGRGGSTREWGQRNRSEEPATPVLQVSAQRVGATFSHSIECWNDAEA